MSWKSLNVSKSIETSSLLPSNAPTNPAGLHASRLDNSLSILASPLAFFSKLIKHRPLNTLFIEIDPAVYHFISIKTKEQVPNFRINTA